MKKLILGKGRANDNIRIFPCKQNSDKNIPWQSAGQGRIFSLFSKKKTFAEHLPGKGQGKREYSDLFLKTKFTKKNIPLGRAGQGRIFRLFCTNKTPKDIPMGKGRAREDSDFCLKNTSENISWVRAGQRSMFRFSLKRKLSKNIPWVRVGQGRIFNFVPKKKTLKKYSLGKGTAKENIQLFF